MHKNLLTILCLLTFLSSFFAFGEELPDDFVFPQETKGPNIEINANKDTGLLSEEGVLRLVNRDHKISKEYVPADLVVPKVPTRKKGMENKILLRQEAAAALEAMFDAAKREAGFTLYATSGYRSFGIQQILFNGRAQELGKETANKTVAVPGSSEHQLGLVMDVQAPSMLNLNRSFGDTEEGKWVAQNAHRFGFIIRYKKEWTDITGYAYEPWHLRYVGLAHSMALFQLNIPFEYYHDIIKDWPEYVLAQGSDILLVGLLSERLSDDASADLPLDMISAHTQTQQASALREATAPFLPQGRSYEQVLWAIYPTPKPTAGPRIDEDEETSLFSSAIHGIAP